MENKIYVLTYSFEGQSNVIVSSYKLETIIDYVRSFLINNLGYNINEDKNYIDGILNSLSNDYMYEGGEDMWQIDLIDII